MRPILPPWMTLQPAPAFAGAGAYAPAASPASAAVGGPPVKVGAPPPLIQSAPGQIRASLFASKPPDFHRADTAPVDTASIDYEAVASEIASVAAAAAADAAASARNVSAYSIYMALYTMRTLRKVILDDEELVKVIVFRSWTEPVSPGERDSMKKISATLELREAQLGSVREALGQKGGMLSRIKALGRTLFGRGQVSGEGPASISPDFTLGMTGRIKSLLGRKRELEREVAKAKIAAEWLDRTAWSHYGYIRITDEGLKVLEMLDRHKGDKRMEEMNIDEYMELVAREGGR